MPVIQNDIKKDNGYEMVNVELEEPKRPISRDTPLIKAAKAGDLEALKECLDKGANLLEIGDSGGTALHWASNNDNFEAGILCSKELIQRALLNSNNSFLLTFLNTEDRIKQTAIAWAAGKGNHKLIGIFLSYGAILPINFRNETLFHIITKLKDSEKAEACAEVLLQHKYPENVNLKEYLDTERTGRKWTALHNAAIAGHHNLMEILIKAGADTLKVDHVGRNVFHRAAGNAFEVKANQCTKVLMKDFLIDEWKEKRRILLEQFDTGGKCPIHITARRGFGDILIMLHEYYGLQEGHTGYTALHSAASLGNQHKALNCVQIILENIKDPEQRKNLLDTKDKDGCTPLYLAAHNKNIEATKMLLLAGSGFDIRSKRGKTPLEKVYEKVPQAINVLLEECVKNSGYIEHINSVNTHAELDFGPILGYSSTKENVYKETEELAKVCYAKFEDRKEILHNTFIKIYIHEKWKKVRWFFITFRLLHIVWFLCNFFLLVSIYRVNCPYKDAKLFSWSSLRPLSDDSANTTTKSLEDCNSIPKLYWCGIFNLVALFVYFLSQFHATKQRLHWIFRPMKQFKEEFSYFERFYLSIAYYTMIFFRILPCWPILLGTIILLSTLPAIGILIFETSCHYVISGALGLLIWLVIYLELGKVPRFRVYINLLMRSTQTLLLAIGVTAPILFGFATVFVVLMPGEPSFSSAAQSFVKVITFMIGELDYEGLFYGEGKENIFSGIVMLALAIFIVIIVVLLVNFLIGLAAEEIRDFWERAEIWELCTKLEQIALLESFLDESVTFCGRGFLRRNLMLMPPERSNDEIVKQRRKACIYIPGLPQTLQKELHELNLETIEENI